MSDKSFQKVHSLFFPVNWQETKVSVDTLIMLASPNDLSEQRIKRNISKYFLQYRS